MNSKANAISTSLIIFCLFSLALSVPPESNAKTREVAKPATKTNSSRSLVSVEQRQKSSSRTRHAIPTSRQDERRGDDGAHPRRAFRAGDG